MDEQVARKVLDKLESELLRELFYKNKKKVKALLKKQESVLSFSATADWLLEDLDEYAGKQRAEKLKERGIECVFDLVLVKPLRVEDYTLRPVTSDGEYYAVKGKVYAKSSTGKVTSITLSTDNGYLFCNWFRLTPYTRRLISSLKLGDEIICEGQVKENAGRFHMHHPRIIMPDKFSERREVIYPSVSGLRGKTLRGMILNALDKSPKKPFDYLPYTLIAANRLPFLSEMLFRLHSDNPDDELVSERLKYDELFLLIMGLKLQESKFKEKIAPSIMPGSDFMDRIEGQLEFELTDDQRRVINEILYDIAKDEPMLRLLQGDVGSGKTIVALMGCIAAIESGYQAAFMAPTQPLAVQVFTEAKKLADRFGFKVGLLTSFSKDKEKTYEKIKSGELQLIVGTHALLQSEVVFKNLGFVVIDEQHRFGVEQRKSLMNKGRFPHVLIMSATPIPRTLSMVLYSRSSLSTIKQKPKGRGVVRSLHFYQKERGKAYEIALREIEKSHQVYVVAPLIENSETLEDIRNVTRLFEELKSGYLRGVEAALLHGHMKPEEKEAVIKAFKEGRIKCLVSTTVIEVGIDSPLATVIIVENAERFGLAQLHQLRGRVGRGPYDSWAIFITPDKLSESARNRIEALLSTSDGFEIAEMDYKLRGSGEIMGTRQHGRDLVFADLVADKHLIKRVKEDVNRLVRMGYPLNDGLKRILEYKWNKRFSYVNVG